MKAEELMISDWVHCITDNVNHRIDSFGTNNRIEVHNPWYISDGKFNMLADIKPILLTSEILEKNGFLINKHVYPYPYYEYINEENKLKIGFAFPQGNKTSYKEPWVCIDTECVYIEHLPCIFVHQLQHTLKLCGIEKEIEL